MARSSKSNTDSARSDLLWHVLGVLLAAAGLLILVSLVSHWPEDPPNSSRPPELSVNLAGWLGAHLSYRLLFAVGYGAYALNGLVFLWSWVLMRRMDPRPYLWRSLQLLAVLVMYCGATGVPSRGRTYAAFRLGGWLGVTLSSMILVPYLGQIGSFILLATALLILLMVVTNLPFRKIPGLCLAVIRTVGQTLAAGFRQSVDAFVGAGRRCLELGTRTLAWAQSRRADMALARIEKREARLLGEAAPDDEPELEEAFDRETDTPPDTLEDEIEPEAAEANDSFEGVEQEVELPAARPAVAPKIVMKPATPARKPPRRAPRDFVSDEDYALPSLDLLETPPDNHDDVDREYLLEGAETLEQSLSSFGVDAKVTQVNPGPVVTSFEVQPPSGVKVNKIVNLSDDLALVMKARSIRIQAPIPGKAAVGIEVPNPNPSIVYLREIFEHASFAKSNSKLVLALGKTADGEPVCADLAKMPHLLIAGATGSGKSFCINALISSILYRTTPQEVRLIMVDPKMLELSIYEGIPHLYSPVVTDPKVASDALKWAVVEMEHRYHTMAEYSVRNIADFNRKLDRMRGEAKSDEEKAEVPARLPYIVVVIDELADLMMTAPADIESSLARLAQMARAVGIHLILATQRPSVNVITGTIKANFPSRIGMRVASKVDSRTILDTNGAEKLLGNGDMLFLQAGKPEPVRIHGAYIDTDETERLVEFLKSQNIKLDTVEFGKGDTDFDMPELNRDEKFEDALRLVVTHQQASASLLQRRMKVGYARAARLVDELEQAGIVAPSDGSSKPREVLVGEDYLESLRMQDEVEEVY